MPDLRGVGELVDDLTRVGDRHRAGSRAEVRRDEDAGAVEVMRRCPGTIARDGHLVRVPVTGQLEDLCTGQRVCGGGNRQQESEAERCGERQRPRPQRGKRTWRSFHPWDSGPHRRGGCRARGIPTSPSRPEGTVYGHDRWFLEAHSVPTVRSGVSVPGGVGAEWCSPVSKCSDARCRAGLPARAVAAAPPTSGHRVEHPQWRGGHRRASPMVDPGFGAGGSPSKGGAVAVGCRGVAEPLAVTDGRPGVRSAAFRGA